jgi:dolichol-phosphate mannosyltransferase
MTKLSVIIPSYKESENIARLSKRIIEVMPSARIFIVDDTPDDSCVKEIEKLALENVELFHRGAKGGRGSAVIHGLKVQVERGSDYILEMDADFSHPPEQIPEMLEKMQRENLDLLIASRYIEGSEIKNWPLSRKLFSAFANRIARLFLRVPVRDYTNGYRLYSKRAAVQIVKSCQKPSKGFIALSEILVNLYYRGYAISEIRTCFMNRVRGESSLSSAEIKDAIKGLVKTFFTIASIKRERKAQVIAQ